MAKFNADHLKAVSNVVVAKATNEPSQASETPQSMRDESVGPSAVDMEAEAKAFICFKDSSDNPAAINPTSRTCGLGQALLCGKPTCPLTDHACQDEWFTSYVTDRYTTWATARAYWQCRGLCSNNYGSIIKFDEWW